MRLSFFALIFFAYSLPAIAQENYGIIINQGEISEAASDLVLYFDDGKVIGHLRNYSNQYGNTYSYLYGEGTPEDKTLTLQNILWQEGGLNEMPPIKLKFIGNRLTVDGIIITLEKRKAPLEVMDPLMTETEIKAGISAFLNPSAKETPPIEETAELSQQTSLNLEKQAIYPLNKTLDTIEKQKEAGTLSQSILDKLADPAFTVQSSFFLLERLPKRAISNRLEKEGNVVWHVATCDETVDREEDYEGKCKDFYFTWDQEVYSGGTVNVEVEVYTTCLDDSCHHEYHQIELVQAGDDKWWYMDHRKGLRCDLSRGGGPPPCD